MHPGLIGGMAGVVLGMAGGVIGTWCALKNVNGPKERAFMRRAVTIGWIAIILFLSLLLLLPNPYRWFVWIPWSLFFSVGLRPLIRKHDEIRREESRAA